MGHYTKRIANLESAILKDVVLFEKAKALLVLDGYQDSMLCRAATMLKRRIERLREQLCACEHIVAEYDLA